MRSPGREILFWAAGASVSGRAGSRPLSLRGFPGGASRSSSPGTPPWSSSCARCARSPPGYLGTKRAITIAVDPGSEVYQACRAALSEAGKPLLRRAQASGDARTDVDDDDIARYIMGAAAMDFASEQQRQKMLGVLFDGLRAR